MNMKRYELWELEYRNRRYLRYANDEQLRERSFEIINNMRILTNENKIGLLSPEGGGEFWMSRFWHVREELRLRDRGLLSISDYAAELKGACEPIPEVQTRLEQLGITPGSYLLKFAERKHNEQALQTGRLLVSSASAYDDEAHLRAVRDRELERTTFALPNEVELTLEAGKHVEPLGAVTVRTQSRSDYYLYCVSQSFARRLFHDFRKDSCLLIHNVNEFVDRFINTVLQKYPEYAVLDRNVEYFDPFDCHREIDVFFMKPFAYAYQQEFRIVWLPPNPIQRLEPFFIELGSLKDCAELII